MMRLPKRNEMKKNALLLLMFEWPFELNHLTDAKSFSRTIFTARIWN